MIKIKQLGIVLLMVAALSMVTATTATSNPVILPLLASTDNNGTEEEGEGGGDNGGGEGNGEESEDEPEPEPETESEPEPELEPELPVEPVQPLLEPAVIPEPIECPEGFILSDIDTCVPEAAAATEEEEEPIDPCLLDPGHESCPEPVDGQCPEGYNMNEDGQCFPEHDQCPPGYHSHEDDESGKCIPDSTPCEDGYIMNPTSSSCEQKDRVCEENPELAECQTSIPDPGCDPNYEGCIPISEEDLDCGDPGVGENFRVIREDPHGFDGDNDGIGCEDDEDNDNDNGDDDERHKTIIKNIDIHKTIDNKQDFPDVDIIGLSVKDTGDAMICIMNIDDDWVQCQEFGVADDRINDENIWRVIETDSDEDYDDANTGSDDVDDAINAIKSQDFSELDDIDNHDFEIDLAALGINPQGDGLICLIEDERNEGTGLCEPFKISETAVSGQITEITEFD